MLGVCSGSVVLGFQRPGRFQRESRGSESHQVACTSMCKAGEETECNQNHGRVCARVFVMPLNVLSFLLFRIQCRGHHLSAAFVPPVLLTQAETLALGEYGNYKTIPEIHNHNHHSWVFFRVLERKPIQNPESGREEMGKSSHLVQRHVCKM